MKQLEADEKLVPVMIYTQNMLVHGEYVAKQAVRVSILLRTEGVPNYLRLQKAHVIVFGGTPPKSLSYPEIFVPTPSVIAFHMAPPAQDVMDYDETEANRIMQPMDMLVGSFQFKGHIRMSAATEIGVTLEVMRISWLSIYNTQITNPYLPQFNLQVPLLVIKPEMVSMTLTG